MNINQHDFRKWTVLNLVVSLVFISIFSPPTAASQHQDENQLSILTSFSPDFYVPFIKKFQRSRPDVKVQVLNKKTTAAIDEIIRGNSRHFDLFWSSSPDAFVVLKREGRLRYLDYIAHYPPLISNQPYSDEQGWFYNFALSGVGYMWNTTTLDEAFIAPPRSWQDLTHPRFYGQVAMSTPSRSGTTHMIVESILQDMGWNGGWKYLMQIAGNMKTITARSFSVPDGVADGRFGVGLMIDFLAHAKSHINAANRFDYGVPTFVMPARIAVLEGGLNISTPVAFIDFLLSKEGQKVLLLPGIDRLPVSQEPNVQNEIKSLPLISLIRQGKTTKYDTDLSTRRYNLVNALFDELITYRLLERKRLWKKLLDLEEVYRQENGSFTDLQEAVIELLAQMPVDGDLSLDTNLNQLFTPGTLSAEQREEKRQLLNSWDGFVSNHFQQAHKLIEGSMASLLNRIKQMENTIEQ